MIQAADRGPDRPSSVVIIDDHDIVRFGLETLLSSRPELQLMGSANRLARGLELIDLHTPDLVLTDMSLPDSGGLDTVRAIVAAQQGRRTLVVSMQSEFLYGKQVLAAGANGYLPKEQAHALLLGAVHGVLSGGTWVPEALSSRLLDRHLHRRHSPDRSGKESLTARELQVLEQLRSGKTSKQIASDLGLSTRTVELYRAAIKKKMGLRTGAEVLAFAFQRF